jgi:hypothetical protein
MLAVEQQHLNVTFTDSIHYPYSACGNINKLGAEIRMLLSLME